MLCVTGAVLLAGGQVAQAARSTPKEPEVNLTGPLFKIAGVQFTIPVKWLPLPTMNIARVGQWQIPSLHGESESGEAVVFYFGPKNGVSPKDNLDAWMGTVVNADGHPATAEVKTREASGFKISQIVVFGTYNQTLPYPGLPPRPHPNYGLFGTVVETPHGNLFFRFTGPATLVTADLPLFNKIIDSIKPVAQ